MIYRLAFRSSFAPTRIAHDARTRPRPRARHLTGGGVVRGLRSVLTGDAREGPLNRCVPATFTSGFSTPGQPTGLPRRPRGLPGDAVQFEKILVDRLERDRSSRPVPTPEADPGTATKDGFGAELGLLALCPPCSLFRALPLSVFS